MNPETDILGESDKSYAEEKLSKFSVQMKKDKGLPNNRIVIAKGEESLKWASRNPLVKLTLRLHKSTIVIVII